MPVGFVLWGTNSSVLCSGLLQGLHWAETFGYGCSEIEWDAGCQPLKYGWGEKHFQDTGMMTVCMFPGKEGYQEFRVREVWSLKIHLKVLYCQPWGEKKKNHSMYVWLAVILCMFVSWGDSNQSSNVPQKYHVRTLSRKTERQGKFVTFYGAGKRKVAGRFRTGFLQDINLYF